MPLLLATCVLSVNAGSVWKTFPSAELSLLDAFFAFATEDVLFVSLSLRKH